MGDLSANFSRYEFACRCGCGFDTVDAELLAVLEVLRARYGRPVTITSAARCAVHNAAVGGAAKSRHVVGQAADLIVAGVFEGRVADDLDRLYPDRYGIGRYTGRTHLDVRPCRARWGSARVERSLGDRSTQNRRIGDAMSGLEAVVVE